MSVTVVVNLFMSMFSDRLVLDGPHNSNEQSIGNSVQISKNSNRGKNINRTKTYEYVNNKSIGQQIKTPGYEECSMLL